MAPETIVAAVAQNTKLNTKLPQSIAVVPQLAGFNGKLLHPINPPWSVPQRSE